MELPVFVYKTWLIGYPRKIAGGLVLIAELSHSAVPFLLGATSLFRASGVAKALIPIRASFGNKLTCLAASVPVITE